MKKNKNTIKEYSNGELTIVWEPIKCIHAGVCVQKLPKVYNPKARPWIQIENATTKELKEQVSACPSAALTYYMNNEIKKETIMEETKIDVMANGPLLIHGKIKVMDAEGNFEIKDKTTAFCRCGVSNKKPYCDGGHSKIGFNG
jgi:uncharacterized Fe-S cluster protein YjdI